MSRQPMCWTMRLATVATACGLGLAASPPAGAQAPVPQGGEFQVNSYTTSFQQFPSVAVDANGDFVVVWYSNGSSGTDISNYSIQGQRYASNGSTQGAQFQINSYTTDSQSMPAAAADADGDFVVVWHSSGSLETDTSFLSIQGQRYASDGSTQGTQFQVNSFTTSFQQAPSVAADADGDFVVIWESFASSGTDTSTWSIQGQRYASDGSTQGAQFQVNTYTTGSQYFPAVAADADGDFVVVWDSNGSSETDTSSWSVQGQRYASDGSAQGAQFQVNSYTTGVQYFPAVAAGSAGDFVVVWRSSGSPGTDTTDFSIQGQRYASDGTAQGEQFQVNSYTTGSQYFPAVAVAPDGRFTVVWESFGSSGTDTSGYSIQGQHYASGGSPQGAQFQVNTHTDSFQRYPSVAADAGGDFVVVWHSFGSSGTDTGSYSIQGQRFDVPAPAPPVPAMSSATRVALGAALMLLGAAVARAYGSVSRRSRFSRYN